MKEPEFWKIVEKVRLSTDEIYERPGKLAQSLDGITHDEIRDFAEIYLDLVARAYTWPLWGAAFVISGGCSDDAFDYFRDWLISEGKEVYARALEDPESLADLEHIEEPELEEFRYVAEEVYEKKTGKTLEFRERQFSYEPSGEAWDEDTVDKMFPKLAEKYW